MSRSALLALAGFASYGILSYFFHGSWLPGQGLAGGAFLIQMLGALGSAGAGLLLLTLLHRNARACAEGSAEMRGAAKILTFAVFALAVLVASSTRSHEAIALFTTLSDAGYKLVLFAAWTLPPARPAVSRAVPLAAALGSYQAGTLAAMAVEPAGEAQFVAVLLCFAFLAADICAATLRRPVPDGRERPGAAAAAESEAAYREALFPVFLAERFNLTRRESEIEGMLEQGATVREIAEALTISQETAKTHRRSVLQKMGVGSSEELQALVERLRAGEFLDYLDDLGSGVRE